MKNIGAVNEHIVLYTCFARDSRSQSTNRNSFQNYNCSPPIQCARGFRTTSSSDVDVRRMECTTMTFFFLSMENVDARQQALPNPVSSPLVCSSGGRRKSTFHQALGSQILATSIQSYLLNRRTSLGHRSGFHSRVRSIDPGDSVPRLCYLKIQKKVSKFLLHPTNPHVSRNS